MKHLTIHILAHCLLFVFGQMASGEVHHLLTHDREGYAHSSAVSVGKTANGEYVLVAAGHAFRQQPTKAWVGIGKRWVPVAVRSSKFTSAEDYTICTFASSAYIKTTPFAQTAPKVGESIQSWGFAAKPEKLDGTVSQVSGTTVYSSGRQHLQGMSGGAVLRVGDHTLLGIISGYTANRNVWTSSTTIQVACARLCFGGS